MPRANRIVIAGKARHCSSGPNFIEMSSRLSLSLSFGTVDHSGGRLAVFDPLRDSDTLHSYLRFSLSVQLSTSFHNQIVSPGHSLSVFLWSGPWASPLGGQRVPNRPPDPNNLEAGPGKDCERHKATSTCIRASSNFHVSIVFRPIRHWRSTSSNDQSSNVNPKPYRNITVRS